MVSDYDILMSVRRKAAQQPAPAAPRRRTRIIPNWKIPGFDAKARVLTSFGMLPIEALRRNDPVKTASGSFAKVTWVDRIGLDANFMTSCPTAQPVSIPAGTFGAARPDRDMLVSPAQVMLIGPNPGSGGQKMLSDMVGWGRISRKPSSSVTYFSFGCAEECVVCVDGMWCVVFPQKPTAQ